MYFQEFSKNDIFKNIIKTHPKYNIYFWYKDSKFKFYLLNNSQNTGSYSINNLFLYSLPLNNAYSGSMPIRNNINAYKLDYNNQSLISWNSSTTTSNDQYSIKYPLTTSIDIKYYESTAAKEDNIFTGSYEYKNRLYSLKNVLNKKGASNLHFLFTSSIGDKQNQELTLISVPSIFYGNTINKGSISLKVNITGALASELQDTKYNGELIVVSGSNVGDTAGVVLYDEGFIMLTGSWQINPLYSYKWGDISTVNNTNINLQLDFEGTNITPTMTLFAHAPKGMFNYSNNPTYIEYGQDKTPRTGSSFFEEKQELKIKNTVKYAYDNFSGSLEKQTFISKIGIFDENKNLLAIVKTSKPMKKTENRDFTFKIKIDY